jgi:hypothetical protein
MIAELIDTTTATIEIPEPSLLRDALVTGMAMAISALMAGAFAILFDRILQGWSLAAKATVAALIPPVLFLAILSWSYAAAEFPGASAPRLLSSAGYVGLVASGFAAFLSAHLILTWRKRRR